MASLLRSGSFLRIFSGFKHSLASSYSRYEVTRIHKLQASHINLSIIRSFAAQKPLENVASPQIPAPSLDKLLYRIDGEIRRTGRISKKDIDDVFGELKFLKYASSTQSLLLIRCCGSLVPEEMPEVRNKLVQEIWDTLQKFNIPVDISHYNALLKVYLENEHKFSPSEFLATLEKNGIEPNRVTYQRLISRYCFDGDIDGASKILEYMKEKGAPVNENVFNALVMGHARANDMESAHAVLGVMQGAGLDPSTETYTMLMIGYAEHGDIEGVNKVLSEAEAADIGLHNREYMEIILALAKNDHTQHMSQFIEKLEKVYGYQQDAMNLIYRLLNVGCDEVAYQLFETMSIPQNAEGDTAPVGIFFIKQLVKSGMYPVSTTIQYCQRMKREGLNMYALERALQFAVTLEKPELAMAIARVMLEDGAPVRSHYFWPILIQYASRGQTEMLFSTIRDMITMEVPISLETCRDYLIPSFAEKGKDEEPTIAALKDCGMPVPSIINGYVAYYLDKSDVSSAAKLLSRYRVKLTKVLRRDLAEAYIKSKDATAAASVLGQMINDFQKKDADAEEAGSIDEEQEKDVSPDRPVQDVGGMFVMDVLMIGRIQNAGVLLEPMLEAMKTRGISISTSSSASVKNRLGEHMTEKILALLDSLSAGDLSLQPLTREPRPLNNLSVEELEHRLTELEIKNLPFTGVLSQLLTIYARMKDVEKAETAKSKLEALEYPLSAGQYALLIDMYAIEGMREKALNLYKDFKTREPDSNLNATKILRLASVMIVEGQFEDAIKLLEENAPDASGEVEDPNLSFACARFLNSVSEKCDIAAIQQLIDVLLQHNYAKKSVSVVCGPLIRAHLSEDNLDGAMEAFEKVCKEYQVTPLKHELTLACIKLEDTVKLQKIMDLSIEIHGEMNSLYDLVFAFIECGKIRQAKKILDTPGLRARHQRLESRCRRLIEDKRFTELEHLVTITKDVFDIDRNMMFMYLFDAYKRQNDCDKALGIWTTMQEENIEPSESFLWELGQLLKKNNRDVPFAMPQPPAVKTSETPVPKPSIPVVEADAEKSQKSVFNKAMREKNTELAVTAKKKLEESGGRLSVTDESKLIEALVQGSKLQEAVKLTRELVVNKQHPLPRIFSFLLNRLAQAGDVESITFFDEHLDENLKKTLSFSNRLCNAYMEAGRTEEFLDSLLSLVESSDVDVASIRGKIPAGGLMGILERQNTVLPKVKELAEKSANHGITAPANCVWMHLFAEGLHAEANEIYNKYFGGMMNDGLLFGPICQKARKTSNPELLSRLVEILNSREDTRVAAKGVAYSCWIDVLCSSEQYDEASSVLEGSLKHIALENYNTTALQRLKDGLAQSNKVFPYTIPKKVKREQSVSSDTD